MKQKILVPVIIVFLFLTCFQAFSEEQFFEITAKKFSYTPKTMRVSRGDEVTIRLLSEDVTHGLYLDGYRLETRAHPGLDGSISFIADKTGRFAFRCSITCGEFHPYMVGFLIVEPNTRLYGFAVLTLVIGFGSLLALIIKKRKS
jgi:cytochrome c oxidase subunit 2